MRSWRPWVKRRNAVSRAAAAVRRSMIAAARDTAFLRLTQGRQDLMNEEDRRYVKLHARERDAVSADLSRVLATSAAGPGHDIALLDGDRITIPRRFPSISVQGEVRAPGL